MKDLNSIFENFIEYLDKREKFNGSVTIGYFPDERLYMDDFLVRAREELLRRGQKDFRIIDMAWFQMRPQPPSAYRDIYVVNEPTHRNI